MYWPLIFLICLRGQGKNSLFPQPGSEREPEWELPWYIVDPTADGCLLSVLLISVTGSPENTVRFHKCNIKYFIAKKTQTKWYPFLQLFHIESSKVNSCFSCEIYHEKVRGATEKPRGLNAFKGRRHFGRNVCIQAHLLGHKSCLYHKHNEDFFDKNVCSI